MRNMELEPVRGALSPESLLEDESHQEFLADIRFVFLPPFSGGAITK